MTDIALTWNAAEGRADLALAGGDLLLDQGLRTAVIISLFTDGLARGDDDLATAIGGNGEDRRGWWGDLPVGGETPRRIGSRLWLLRRAKATEGTRLRAVTMIREALAWMLQDGVVDRIEVEAVLAGTPPDRLLVTLTLRRGAVSDRFDLPWAIELSR
jgi:phage gp46-like protein